MHMETSNNSSNQSDFNNRFFSPYFLCRAKREFTSITFGESLLMAERNLRRHSSLCKQLNEAERFKMILLLWDVFLVVVVDDMRRWQLRSYKNIKCPSFGSVQLQAEANCVFRSLIENCGWDQLHVRFKLAIKVSEVFLSTSTTCCCWRCWQIKVIALNEIKVIGNMHRFSLIWTFVYHWTSTLQFPLDTMFGCITNFLFIE